MPLGDLVGAVTPSHEVLVGGRHGRGFIAVFRYLQTLSYIEFCIFQTVEFLDLFGGGPISPCNGPEGITTAHLVGDGISGRLLLGSARMGYDGSPLRDFQLFSCHDQV